MPGGFGRFSLPFFRGRQYLRHITAGPETKSSAFAPAVPPDKEQA